MEKGKIASAILLIACGLLAYQYYALLTQIKDLKIQLASLQNKLNTTIYEKRVLESELSKYKVELSTLQAEVDTLRNTLKTIEMHQKLNNKVSDWLYQNFYYNFSSARFINRVAELCIQKDKINLPCAVNVIQKEYGFHYENDTEDTLKGVDQFIRDKGGDCEDWALFTAALTNYFIREYPNKLLELYIPKEGSSFTLYIENNERHYYKNCAEYSLNISRYYPSILCYKEGKVGHCIVGFSKEYLTPENLYSERTYLIESQTGQYLGTLSNFTHEIYIIANPRGLFVKRWSWWI